MVAGAPEQPLVLVADSKAAPRVALSLWGCLQQQARHHLGLGAAMGAHDHHTPRLRPAERDGNLPRIQVENSMAAQPGLRQRATGSVALRVAGTPMVARFWPPAQQPPVHGLVCLFSRSLVNFNRKLVIVVDMMCRMPTVGHCDQSGCVAGAVRVRLSHRYAGVTEHRKHHFLITLRVVTSRLQLIASRIVSAELSEP